MKGTSKVIMGATLVMVVSLAMVLGLILVLLAELYCSLLLRRRRSLRSNSDTATAAAADPEEAATSTPPHCHPYPDQQSSSDDHHTTTTTATSTPLRSFYAHGVLQAPRSLLFPAISFKEDCLNTKKQLSTLHHQAIIDVPSPQPQPEPAQQEKKVVGEDVVEHFVYISNPVYENAETRLSSTGEPNTPFETPDTSPSRLEMPGSASGSSGEEYDEAEIVKTSTLSSHSSPPTPPLTPMKKLPAEACSVSLRDARSLATSGSDSTSSSSGSPCTSPSW